MSRHGAVNVVVAVPLTGGRKDANVLKPLFPYRDIGHTITSLYKPKSGGASHVAIVVQWCNDTFQGRGRGGAGGVSGDALIGRGAGGAGGGGGGKGPADVTSSIRHGKVSTAIIVRAER